MPSVLLSSRLTLLIRLHIHCSTACSSTRPLTRLLALPLVRWRALLLVHLLARPLARPLACSLVHSSARPPTRSPLRLSWNASTRTFHYRPAALAHHITEPAIDLVNDVRIRRVHLLSSVVFVTTLPADAPPSPPDRTDTEPLREPALLDLRPVRIHHAHTALGRPEPRQAVHHRVDRAAAHPRMVRVPDVERRDEPAGAAHQPREVRVHRVPVEHAQVAALDDLDAEVDLGEQRGGQPRERGGHPFVRLERDGVRDIQQTRLRAVDADVREVEGAQARVAGEVDGCLGKASARSRNGRASRLGH